MRMPRFLLAALLGGLFVCAHLHWASAQTAPAVVVAPAAIIDMRPSAHLTGRVVAEQKVGIRARVSGFLEAINFTEGQKVTAGTVLYEVEDGSYRAALQEIEGSIKSAEAQRALKQINVDRKAQLVKRGASPQSELDLANAELGQAEGDLLRLNGSKQNAELQLSYTKIVAPFDGVIGLSSVDVGALVSPDTGVLATLTRLDPINVEAPVAMATVLRHRQRVAKGEVTDSANVELLLPDGTTYPHKGTINFIASTVAQGTDTVIVRAGFPNPDGILLDGALVRVTLEQTDAQKVLAVPQEAVQRDQVGAFVMVVGPDSVVELRRVDIAHTARGQAVIAKGLKEGELVITEGVGKVRPGIKVDAAQATSG